MSTSQLLTPCISRVDRGKTLRELTLEHMRGAILDGHIKPGERLIERRLCEQLEVSRSVVREVLRHLETEGIVESIPGQGPIVATLSAGQAAQIYEIRSLLEGQAAFHCAQAASDEDIEHLANLNIRIQEAFEQGDLREVMSRTSTFYEAMFRTTGSDIAWDMVQSLNARINLLRFITISAPGRKTEAAAEMESLVVALRKRDPDAARQAAQDHITRVADIARQRLAGD